MKASFVGTQAFERACREALAMLLWCSGEEFDGKSVEDCAEETLQVVSGEVFAMCKKLQTMGKLEKMSAETLAIAATGIVGQALGSGASIYDRDLYDFSKGEVDELYEWQRQRSFYCWEPYIGDDGKVYIFGKHKKLVKIRMSLSKGLGQFGAMFDFAYEAVTADVAAMRAALDVVANGWEKNWIKGYEEVPA